MMQTPRPSLPTPDSARRARVLPPPRKIEFVLSPADFTSALKHARSQADPGVDALAEAAASVDPAAQRVVSARHSPALEEIRSIGKVLGEIERGCLSATRPIVEQLEEEIPEENALETLARELRRSRDPVVIALLNTASAFGGDETDGRLLAQTLLAIDRLRAWARASRIQFEAGAAREKQSRKSPEARSPARIFGFALIESYASLTGGKPRFARKSDGGAPGGPTEAGSAPAFFSQRRVAAAGSPVGSSTLMIWPVRQAARMHMASGDTARCLSSSGTPADA